LNLGKGVKDYQFSKEREEVILGCEGENKGFGKGREESWNLEPTTGRRERGGRCSTRNS